MDARRPRTCRRLKRRLHRAVTLQGRDEDLLDVSEKGLAGHRAVEHHRRAEPGTSQRGDKGGCLPVAERRLGEEPPAAPGAAVEPGHLGAGTGLVDEDELVEIDKGPRGLPNTASRRDVRAVLLARAERLFLNDSPSRATADHIAPFDSRTSCSANSHACNAASVRSGCASICAASAASCAGDSLRGRWPRRGLALTSPVRRRRINAL